MGAVFLSKIYPTPIEDEFDSEQVPKKVLKKDLHKLLHRGCNSSVDE